LFFGPIYTHYHLPNLYSYFVFLFFLVLVYERARAASKHVHKNKKEQEHEVFLFFLVHYSVSIYFIRIFFTSKPIHELRLDLNVANTVIALTIRVIYLSLIITLKRGVVVLWFTVTCPLSSEFSIVNIRRRTSRSALKQLYVPAHPPSKPYHNHQTSKRSTGSEVR